MNTFDQKQTGLQKNKPILRYLITALSSRPFHFCHCADVRRFPFGDAEHWARTNASR